MSQTLLGIVVHPRKPFFGFVKKDAWSGAWHLDVMASPQHYQANAEIEKECSRLFGVQVKIIRGHSSSKKVLGIPLAREICESIIEQRCTRLPKKESEKKYGKNIR